MGVVISLPTSVFSRKHIIGHSLFQFEFQNRQGKVSLCYSVTAKEVKEGVGYDSIISCDGKEGVWRGGMRVVIKGSKSLGSSTGHRPSSNSLGGDLAPMELSVGN